MKIERPIAGNYNTTNTMRKTLSSKADSVFAYRKLDPYTTMLNKFKQEQNSNLDEDLWQQAANKGELDQYINLLMQSPKESSKLAELKSQYGDLLDYDTAMLALSYDSVADDVKEDRYDDKGNLLGNFSQKELIDEALNQQKLRFDAQILEDAKRSGTFWEKADAFAIGLSGEAMAFGVDFAADATRVIGDTVNTLSSGFYTIQQVVQGRATTFEDIAEAYARNSSGQVWDDYQQLGFGNQSAFAKKNPIVGIDDFAEELNKAAFEVRREYSYTVDATTGEYNSWGKLLHGMADSLGYMSLAMIGGGPLAMYAPMFTANVKENVQLMGANPNYSKLITNAATKAGVEFAIEWTLNRFIGSTGLNRLMKFNKVASKLGAEAVSKGITQGGVKAVKTFAIHAAKEALQEGIEETLQESSGMFIDYIYGDQYASRAKDNFSLETLSQAFIIGAATSMAITNVQMTMGQTQIGVDDKGNTVALGKIRSYNYAQSLSTMMEWQTTAKDPKANVKDRIDAALKLEAVIATLGSVYESAGIENAVKAEKLLLEVQAHHNKKVSLKDKVANGTYINTMLTNLNNEVDGKNWTEAFNAVDTAATNLISDMVSPVVGAARQYKAKPGSAYFSFSKVMSNLNLQEQLKNSGVTTLETPVDTTAGTKVEPNTIFEIAQRLGFNVVVRTDGRDIIMEDDVIFIPADLQDADTQALLKAVATQKTISNIIKNIPAALLVNVVDHYSRVIGSAASHYAEGELERQAIAALMFDKNFQLKMLLRAQSEKATWGTDQVIDFILNLKRMVAKTYTTSATEVTASGKPKRVLSDISKNITERVVKSLQDALTIFNMTTASSLIYDDAKQEPVLDKQVEDIIGPENASKIKANPSNRFSAILHALKENKLTITPEIENFAYDLTDIILSEPKYDSLIEAIKLKYNIAKNKKLEYKELTAIVLDIIQNGSDNARLDLATVVTDSSLPSSNKLIFIAKDDSNQSMFIEGDKLIADIENELLGGLRLTEVVSSTIDISLLNNQLIDLFGEQWWDPITRFTVLNKLIKQKSNNEFAILPDGTLIAIREASLEVVDELKTSMQTVSALRKLRASQPDGILRLKHLYKTNLGSSGNVPVAIAIGGRNNGIYYSNLKLIVIQVGKYDNGTSIADLISHEMIHHVNKLGKRDSEVHIAGSPDSIGRLLNPKFNQLFSKEDARRLNDYLSTNFPLTSARMADTTKKNEFLGRLIYSLLYEETRANSIAETYAFSNMGFHYQLDNNEVYLVTPDNTDRFLVRHRGKSGPMSLEATQFLLSTLSKNETTQSELEPLLQASSIAELKELAAIFIIPRLEAGITIRNTYSQICDNLIAELAKMYPKLDLSKITNLIKNKDTMKILLSNKYIHTMTTSKLLALITNLSNIMTELNNLSLQASLPLNSELLSAINQAKTMFRHNILEPIEAEVVAHEVAKTINSEVANYYSVGAIPKSFDFGDYSFTKHTGRSYMLTQRVGNKFITQEVDINTLLPLRPGQKPLLTDETMRKRFLFVIAKKTEVAKNAKPELPEPEKNSKSANVKSGKEVADYISRITPDEAYVPDYYLEKYVINNNWVLKRIAITEIFKDDVVVKNFEEFEKQLEQDPNYLYRYSQDEVDADKLFLPIVFYDDGSKPILIDGFSRARMHVDLGKKTILAYVLDKTAVAKTDSTLPEPSKKTKAPEDPIWQWGPWQVKNYDDSHYIISKTVDTNTDTSDETGDFSRFSQTQVVSKKTLLPETMLGSVGKPILSASERKNLLNWLANDNTPYFRKKKMPDGTIKKKYFANLVETSAVAPGQLLEYNGVEYQIVKAPGDGVHLKNIKTKEIITLMGAELQQAYEKGEIELMTLTNTEATLASEPAMHRFNKPKPANRSYISNKRAAKSNLKYFIKKGRILNPHPDVVAFVEGTTTDFDKLAKYFQVRILKGTLTRRDIINYVHTTKSIDDYTWKALAELVYKNEALANLSPALAQYFFLDADKLTDFAVMARLTENDDPALNRINTLADFKKLSNELNAKLKDPTNNVEFIKKYWEVRKTVDTWWRLNEEGKTETRDDWVIDEKQLLPIFMRHFDGTLRSLNDIFTIAKRSAGQQILKSARPDSGNTEDDGKTTKISSSNAAVENNAIAKSKSTKYNWLDNIRQNVIDYTKTGYDPDLDEEARYFEDLTLDEKYYIVEAYLYKKALDYVHPRKATEQEEYEADQEVREALNNMDDAEIDKMVLFILDEARTAPKVSREKIDPKTAERKSPKDQLRNRTRSLITKLAGSQVLYNKLPNEIKALIEFTPTSSRVKAEAYTNLSEAELRELSDKVADEIKAIQKARQQARDLEKTKATIARKIQTLQNKERKLAEKEVKVKAREKALKTGTNLKSKLNITYETKVAKQPFTITSSSEINPKLQTILDHVWDNTTLSKVKYMDDSAQTVQNVHTAEEFYKAHAGELSAMTLAEIEEVTEWLINAQISSNDSVAKQTFEATQFFILAYIYNETGSGLFANMNANLKQELTTYLKAIQTSAGTLLSLIKSVKGKLNPVSIITTELFSKFEYEIPAIEQERLDKALSSGNIKDITEILTTIKQNALAQVVPEKTSALRKVAAVRSMSMTSSPMTWLRNIISNYALETLNPIASKLGDTFLPKLTAKTENTPTQYKLDGKITPEIQQFITEQFIDSGFFNETIDQLSKYNPSQVIRHKKAGEADIIGDMLIHAIYNQYYSESMFNSKMLNQIHSFLMQRLSDKSWVRRAAVRYLGKLLAETNHHLDDNGNLKTTVDKELLTDVANAFALATTDYMHSDNFFSHIEKWLTQHSQVGWAAYKTIMPFATASWNWFKAAIRYSPIGLGQSIVRLTRLEQEIIKRESAWQKGDSPVSPELTTYLVRRDLGSGIIGTLSFGFGAILAALGYISLEDDDWGTPKLRVGNVRIDISTIFGSSSVLAGAAFIQTLQTKDLASALDAMLDPLVDGFFFTDLLQMDANSPKGWFEWTLYQAQSIMLSFIPSAVRYVSGMTYTGTYRANTLFQKAVVRLPFLGQAFNVPKKTNIYTGDTDGTFWDIVHRAFPYFELVTKSRAQTTTEMYGLNKEELHGTYIINDVPFKTSAKETARINKLYGEANANDLTDFYANKKAYRVLTENNRYATKYYSNMTPKEIENALNQIFSKNSTMAKISAWLTAGNSYYTNDRVLFNELRALGYTKVYIGNKGFTS